jgi:5-methylcytosine-specific restriction protein A
MLFAQRCVRKRCIFVLARVLTHVYHAWRAHDSHDLALVPQRPKRPCARAGCPRLVDRGYCDDCAPSAPSRQSSHDRGYDWRWRRASRSFIRANPLCCYCELAGRVTATECVDHAEPHRGDDALFWDVRNWRPACVACNSAKGTMSETAFVASIRRRRGEGGSNP